MLQNNSFNLVKARGKVSCNNRITPDMHIEIKNVSADGCAEYQVTTVHHVLNSTDGYTTEFDARRNMLPGNSSKPEKVEEPELREKTAEQENKSEEKQEKKAKMVIKETEAVINFTHMPVANAKVSSKYGIRKDVDTSKVGNFHGGVDYAVTEGTSVVTVGNNTHYGYFVAIEHDNGVTSYSLHLKSYTVKAGESVIGGNEIGKSGNTGSFSAGPLLHFLVFSNTRRKSADHTKRLVVREGETLAFLSAREYNDPGKWRFIADANNISDPENIAAGTIVELPPLY